MARPDGGTCSDKSMSDLPTPRTMATTGFRMSVWCKACHHRTYADWQRLIDAGRGDVPIVKLRWRCVACGSRMTDAVVAGDHLWHADRN